MGMDVLMKLQVFPYHLLCGVTLPNSQIHSVFMTLGESKRVAATVSAIIDWWDSNENGI